MELGGTATPHNETNLDELKELLIDMTMEEAFYLAECLDRIAAGENVGGRVDDGANVLLVYLKD